MTCVPSVNQPWMGGRRTTTLLTSVRCVSIIGDSPETVTVSLTPAGRIRTSMDWVCPTSTEMFSIGAAW